VRLTVGSEKHTQTLIAALRQVVRDLKPHIEVTA